MSSDPHEGKHLTDCIMPATNTSTGGSLTDMAVDGTSIPGDAGAQRIIPSVPDPTQQAEQDIGSAQGGLGAPDLASAADNAVDIPRGPGDAGTSDEMVTGTGDEMPAEVMTKNLHFGDGPAAKGNLRDAKAGQQKGSDEELYARDGADMEPAPGQEGLEQEEIREQNMG